LWGTPLNPKPYLKFLEVPWKEEKKKMGCNSNDMSQRCPWRANSQHVCIARKPAANKHEKTVGLYVSSSSDNEDCLDIFRRVSYLMMCTLGFGVYNYYMVVEEEEEEEQQQLYIVQTKFLSGSTLSFTKL
jgi:hypothetical protein